MAGGTRRLRALSSHGAFELPCDTGLHGAGGVTLGGGISSLGVFIYNQGLKPCPQETSSSDVLELRGLRGQVGTGCAELRAGGHPG